MAEVHTVIRNGKLALILWIVASLFFLPAMLGEDRNTLEAEKLRIEVEKLRAEVAVLKGDPSRSALEKQKLEQEVQKLQQEVAVLKASAGVGHYLPLLQAVGVGSLLGGLLVWFAGRSLSKVQREKLEQDLQFGREDHQLQSRKLVEEIAISRSEHDLKLFEGLGAADPRIRIGAASELGQRVRQLNEQLAASTPAAPERNAQQREKETIIRVLIAVTKHEKSEELQKHIADLIVDVLDALNKTLPASPLAQFDFQGAKLTNAWWKGVNANGVDFYRASMPTARRR